MKSSIEFIDGIKESALPIIKLTRSPNKETGTVSFVFFYNQTNFKNQLFNNKIKGMFLKWNNDFIFTKNIEILFDQGKPFLIKSVILLKDSNEWFRFLNFMVYYSVETGLFFQESV